KEFIEERRMEDRRVERRVEDRRVDNRMAEAEIIFTDLPAEASAKVESEPSFNGKKEHKKIDIGDLRKAIEESLKENENFK
ncbi:MAG: hypothetical protein AAB696_00295, partial [Patescibacteria group bacterium]